MGIVLKYLARATVVASMALVAGCAADNADFAQPDNVINPEDGVASDSNDGSGYFSIADLSVAINTDNESIVSTKSTSFNEASDDYLIIIQNESTGEEFYRNTYATTKTLTEPVTLPVGNYVLWATSIEEVPATDWDNPQYASIYRTFSIGSEKTTEIVDDVVCTMSNIKTSVTMSADLKALFKSSEDLEDGEPALEVTLGLGDAALTYSETETRNGYFAVQPENNTISVTLSGMYNTAAADEEPSYAAIEWAQSIPEVTSGQARDVQIEILHYNEGVMEIAFTVVSWVYDEVLGVQLSQAFYTSFEEEIYDPDSDASDPYSPVIALNGGSDYSYYVYPTSFDDEALTYSPDYSVTIAPQFGSSVSTASVELTSTNTEIVTDIVAAGFDSSLELWSNGVANSNAADLVSISSDGSGTLTATITYDGMKLLSSYSGTHTLKLIVVDSEGRRSVTFLAVNSIISDKLDIIWDGYSFDDVHEISYYDDAGGYVELPVVFSITSKTGLTKLSIDIESGVLTPDELATLSLAASMDLINPATEAMEGALRELGFPVGSDIEGSVMLTFDITNFMPLLAMLSDEGSKDETKFVITAGDESGECVQTLTVVRK